MLRPYHFPWYSYNTDYSENKDWSAALIFSIVFPLLWVALLRFLQQYPFTFLSFINTYQSFFVLNNIFIFCKKKKILSGGGIDLVWLNILGFLVVTSAIGTWLGLSIEPVLGTVNVHPLLDVKEFDPLINCSRNEVNNSLTFYPVLADTSQQSMLNLSLYYLKTLSFGTLPSLSMSILLPAIMYVTSLTSRNSSGLG